VKREELKFKIWLPLVARVVVWRSVFRVGPCISLLEQGVIEGENPVFDTDYQCFVMRSQILRAGGSMFDIVVAVIAAVSVSIFLVHAVEAYLTQ